MSRKDGFVRPLASVMASMAIAACLFAPGPVAAATITVTTTADVVAADGECSLREAVIAANADVAVDVCPAGGTNPDAIQLEGGTYTLTIPGMDEDAALTGDLDLLGNTIVRGAFDGSSTTIDGGGLDRVFDVLPGSVGSFADLVITGGTAASADGGGIRLRDNAPPAGSGCVDSTDVRVESTIIHANRAARGGGIYVGHCGGLELLRAAVADNTSDSDGGGIALDGASSLVVGTTFSGNTAATDGGAISTGGPFPAAFFSSTAAENAAARGAGIAIRGTLGDVTIRGFLLAGNAGANCVIENPAIVSLRYSLSSDASCGGGEGVLVSTDPHLLPRDPARLAYRLATNSPAIDAAPPPSDCPDSLLNAFDVYGTVRPQDGDGDGVAVCDIGAVEMEAVPVATSSPRPRNGTGTLPDTAMADPARPVNGTDVALTGVAASVAMALAVGARGRRRGIRRHRAVPSRSRAD